MAMQTKPDITIAVAVDGSQSSLRALDYIRVMFGHQHHLKLALVYSMPSLPRLLIEECSDRI